MHILKALESVVVDWSDVAVVLIMIAAALLLLVAFYQMVTSGGNKNGRMGKQSNKASRSTSSRFGSSDGQTNPRDQDGRSCQWEIWEEDRSKSQVCERISQLPPWRSEIDNGGAKWLN